MCTYACLEMSNEIYRMANFGIFCVEKSGEKQNKEFVVRKNPLIIFIWPLCG